jgi:hypothetical protein
VHVVQHAVQPVQVAVKRAVARRFGDVFPEYLLQRVHVHAQPLDAASVSFSDIVVTLCSVLVKEAGGVKE